MFYDKLTRSVKSAKPALKRREIRHSSLPCGMLYCGSEDELTPVDDDE